MIRIGTGVEVAAVMAEAMKAMSWDTPVIEPEPSLRRNETKPTGVAKAKRAAKARKNIRARSKK